MKAQKGNRLQTCLLVVWAMAACLCPQVVAATTRTVTSLNDDDGEGTLRFLIGASAAGDTINFSVTGTILLTRELVIARNLKIIGPGASVLTVRGNYSFRVLRVSSPITFSISDLTIEKGGGGVYNNGGTLTLDNCTIQGCRTTTDGGGIFNSGGVLTLNNCALSSNSSNGGGGGIYNSGGALTLNNCTVADNSSSDYGGGISNAAGTLKLNNCTLANNRDFFGGGGIVNNGTSTLNNCTLAKNTGPLGGGIYNYGGGALTLNSCTLAYNTADPVGNGGGGGIVNSIGATATILNTIIANNTAYSGPDISGAITSLGHNLVGKTDHSSGWIATDLTGTIASPLNPQLGPLQDNGGPTLTMTLLPTSAAIDAGDDAVTNMLLTDQRGRPRRAGAQVDIGAFEYEPPQAGPLFVVTTTDDHDDGVAGAADCTFREALIAANANPDNNSIAFAPGVTGTITLRLGELVISQNVAIAGPGANVLNVNANQASRVFNIAASQVAISGLTISGGLTEVDGGGIFHASGALTLDSCAVTDNRAPNGGGIRNEAGSLTISNCTVSGNYSPRSVGSSRGGGLYANTGDVAIFQSTFSGNTLLGLGMIRQGGGIYQASGTLILIGCTIVSNIVERPGGRGAGIYRANGTRTSLGNSLVARNVTGTAVNAPVFADLAGSFSSTGYNLIGQGEGGSGFSNGVNHDQVGSINGPLDPIIGPLQENGGPTLTHALLVGSPAIDHGGPGGPATDQRGRARSYDFPSVPNASGGDGSDIGAFELNPPALRITRAASSVVLSWPTAETGYTLEARTNLNPSAPWTAIPGSPVIVGGQFTITNPAPTGGKFYRLSHP